MLNIDNQKRGFKPPNIVEGLVLGKLLLWTALVYLVFIIFIFPIKNGLLAFVLIIGLASVWVYVPARWNN